MWASVTGTTEMIQLKTRPTLRVAGAEHADFPEDRADNDSNHGDAEKCHMPSPGFRRK